MLRRQVITRFAQMLSLTPTGYSKSEQRAGHCLAAGPIIGPGAKSNGSHMQKLTVIDQEAFRNPAQGNAAEARRLKC